MAAAKQREQPPQAQLGNYRKLLESAERLPRVTVARGDEGYFRGKIVEAAVAAAKRLDTEVIVHDGADPDYDAQTLMGDLATLPMFASRQLIVVRNTESALAKRGKDQPPLVRALLAFIERGDPERAVCLTASSMRADHALAKAAKKAECPVLNVRRLYETAPPWKPDPRQSELALYVGIRARELGMPLSPDQALMVAQATGNDLSAIDDQLQRVKRSGPEKLGETLGFQAGGSPFAVADALIEGRSREAVSGIEALWRAGMVQRDGGRVVDGRALAAMLTSALVRGTRQGYAAAVARAAGAPPSEAARLAGVAGAPRTVEGFLGRIQKRPDPARWLEMLHASSNLERRAKGGAGVDANDLSHLALQWALFESSAAKAAKR